MLIVNGLYRIAKKRTACRNDFCTHCGRGTFVEGFRSLHVIHLYWIPLIPLGFITEWRCTRCGKDPAGRRPMSVWLAATGLVTSLIGVALAFLIPGEDFDAADRWVLGGVFGFLALVTGYFLYVGKAKTAVYRSGRAAVPSLPSDICPYCGDPTLQSASPRCGRCDVSIR